MVNLSVIKMLCKEKGWSLSYLCRKLGLSASYFSDVRNGKTKISDGRLHDIADILNTTPEYLKGETSIKEKAPTVEVDDERSAKRKMLFDLFNSMTDEELDAMIAFTNAIQKKIDQKKK